MKKQKKYTDKQKIAYYKKKAQAAESSAKPYYRKIRGHGDYKISDNKKGYKGYGAYLGAGLGSAIGTAIAPGIGTALGGPIGGVAGYMADKIFGWGDYTIKKNTLLFHNQPAMFDGPEHVRVRHREFICNISSTTSFTNQSFPLNPGLRTSFPWLSAIAENFEQYRWNGFIAEYHSTSADALNSTNTALGALMMATDYDPADSSFSNKQQMLGNYFSNSGKPACDMMHAVECAPGSTPMEWYYVRAQSVPSGKDNRLYDLANFQIATEGSQASAVIGELWFNYDVTFSKRQMNNTLGLALPTDHFSLLAPSTSAYFGTDYATNTGVSGSNLGCTLGAATITFPPNLAGGTYFVSWSVNGASTVIAVPTWSLTNCSALNVFNNDSQDANGTPNGNTTVRLTMSKVIKISAQGAVITLSGGTLPSSPTYGDLWIAQVNGNIST